MKDKIWLHNGVLSLLSGKLYDPLLTVEHLNPFKIEIKKMTQPDFVEDEKFNFRGWELVKDGKKYLISDKDNQSNPVSIKKLLPVLPKMPIELGYRGNVYTHIKRPISMRTRSEKHHEFPELIKMMSSMKSTNQDHQVMMTVMSFVARNSKTNFARCSNPGFGKDFDIVRHNALGGKCASIESPTLAKLELLSPVMKLLNVNEICSMSGEAWRITQGYLLSFGAHLDKVPRHSCGVGRAETLEVQDLSLILSFNDITNYKKPMDKFFDYATDDQVLDRFMRFRFWGSYTEDFNALLKGIDKYKYTDENLEDFRKLRYSYKYHGDMFKKHRQEVLHNWDRGDIVKETGRDNTNMSNLLDGFDYLSQTQEQMNHWVNLIKLSQKDYRVMTSFPFALEGLLTKMKVPKATIEKAMNNFNAAVYRKHNDEIHDGIVISWIKGKYLKKGEWTNQDWKYNLEYLNAIYKANTFIEKGTLINLYINKEDKVIEDKSVWS